MRADFTPKRRFVSYLWRIDNETPSLYRTLCARSLCNLRLEGGALMVVAYYNMFFREHILHFSSCHRDVMGALATEAALVHRPGESFWIVPGTINEDNVDEFYYSD